MRRITGTDIIIHPASASDMQDVFFCLSEIYEPSFPTEERRPKEDIIDKIVSGDSRYAFYLIKKKDRLVGMISIWRFDDANYVEHFAVSREERGNGIGRQVMRHFVASGEPMCLECEHPTDEMSIRRLNFYLSLGYKIADKDYIQPPYMPNLPSLPLYFLTANYEGGVGSLEGEVRRKVYGVR